MDGLLVTIYVSTFLFLFHIFVHSLILLYPNGWATFCCLRPCLTLCCGPEIVISLQAVVVSEITRQLHFQYNLPFRVSDARETIGKISTERWELAPSANLDQVLFCFKMTGKKWIVMVCKFFKRLEAIFCWHHNLF